MNSGAAGGVHREPEVIAETILGALTEAVIVADAAGTIGYANPAAEQFFMTGRNLLLGRRLAEFIPADSPLFALLSQVAASGVHVAESGVTIVLPRIGSRFCSIKLDPLGETGERVVISFLEQSIARKMDRQMLHRGAARSVSGMAAMLAHEVKNPLSGIRGAAQLLEQSVGEADRNLTQLICDETDRIVALVDRMEAFSDGQPSERRAVNIHQVLSHVRKVAETGFGRHVRFHERYDPSLPPVFGDRDQLVQVFLNLVKNACEAVPATGAEVTLSTGYRQGVRLAIPGSDSRIGLPLHVQVQDNGEGVPEHLRGDLFDAFVTSKPTGSGLGLALVAKIVNDHGGVVEFESEPRRTIFSVLLPLEARRRERSVAGISEDSAR